MPFLAFEKRGVTQSPLSNPCFYQYIDPFKSTLFSRLQFTSSKLASIKYKVEQPPVGSFKHLPQIWEKLLNKSPIKSFPCDILIALLAKRAPHVTISSQCKQSHPL
ncbi:hypothetical protein QL285_033166 [Trifolium repens]|nr:hypothetical protein QL285_033166 [Trifolium repens]